MNSMRYFVLAIAITGSLAACKKKSGDTPTPTVDKPRVGTTWTYRYRNFDGAGTAYPPISMTVKATAEQTLGGESWISLDSAGTVNWYKVKLKSDGLYQYANSASYLLCKDPGTLNETYTGYNTITPYYNDGNAYPGKDTIAVKGVNVSVDVPIDILTVNYYEGSQKGNVVEKIWYNSKYWIVKKETWALNTFTMIWHVSRRWELTNITF